MTLVLYVTLLVSMVDTVLNTVTYLYICRRQEPLSLTVCEQPHWQRGLRDHPPLCLGVHQEVTEPSAELLAGDKQDESLVELEVGGVLVQTLIHTVQELFEYGATLFVLPTSSCPAAAVAWKIRMTYSMILVWGGYGVYKYSISIVTKC